MVIWWRPPVRAGSFEEDRTGPEPAWRPELDIYESSADYLLVFDLPGVRREDLDVTVSGRTLTVAGVRRLALPAGTVAHLVEGPRGAFERRVRLPATADPARLRTELRDGQLSVLIGKTVPARVAVRVDVTPS